MAGFKQTFIQALTEVSTIQKDDLGTIRIEGPKVYKYVLLKNTTAGGVAAVAGDCVSYLATTGARDSQVVTDWTDASTAPVAAGGLLAAVSAAETAPTQGVYVWIQVSGPFLAKTIGAGTAGQALKAHATNDKQWNTRGAATDPYCGSMIEGSGTDKQVVLRCP